MANVKLPALKVACKAAVALQAIKRLRLHEWKLHAKRVNDHLAMLRKWFLMFWLKPLTLEQVIERYELCDDPGAFNEFFVSPNNRYVADEKRLRQIMALTRLGAPYVGLVAEDLELMEKWGKHHAG